MEKKKQGFATLDESQRREAASKAGIAAQASGKAYQFNSETGKAAGRKGGKARLAALTPERRREIARMGGLATARNRRKKK